MKIVFLLAKVQEERGVFHSTLRQAAALGSRHDVEVWVVSNAARSDAWAPPGVRIRSLTTVADGTVTAADGLRRRDLEALGGTPQPSRLVPWEWERTFTAVSDVALERALSGLRADVLVSSSPGTLAAAVRWARPGTALVHQERFRPLQRIKSLEALRVFGGRLDALVAGDDLTAAHFRTELGQACPPVSTLPDSLPLGFLPSSRGTSNLIVAAGCLTPEQNFNQLIRSFGLVADQMPGWRLRIFGQGPLRRELEAQSRKALLFDRVELPGNSPDMRSEWARASVAAVTARGSVSLSAVEAMAAGLPVVASRHPDGCAQIMENERNGLLVLPGSTTALADALLRLAEDPALRRNLGAAAAASAQQHRPEAVAGQWEELFERVRAGRRRDRMALPAHGAVQDVAPDASDTTAAPPELAPAEALHRTLRLLTATAESVADEWLVLRPVRDRGPVLAVPSPHRDAFLTQLAANDDLGLEVVAEEETGNPQPPAGPLSGVVDLVRRAQPSLVPLSVPRTVGGRATLGRHGCQVDVEFWDVVGQTLVPPRVNEWVTAWIRGSDTREIDVVGLRVPTVPLAAEATIYDRPFPIDAVYTWVDGEDPEWQAKRDARLAETTGLSLTRAASGRARFVSRDELRYSMRSLHLFAPWLRHIYLVTDGQVPDWLDDSHPYVTVVPHGEILRRDHLPTFNSHAIETGLHRIPSLSENFIYFNDDVLLGRPMRPDQFFNAAGEFAAFVGEQVLGEDAPDALPFRRAGLNNRALLEKDFGRVITRTIRHTPHPFRREVLEALEQRYPEAMTRTAAAAFRSETDHSVASSLAQHFGLLTGAAYEATLESIFVPITEARLEAMLDGILATRPYDALCFADHHDWALPEARVNALMREFFDSYYPVVAPWEGPGPE